MKINIDEKYLNRIIQESINGLLLEMSPALLTQEKVIQQFITMHGENRYDYSKVKYVNDRTKVIIGCPLHKRIYWFEQLPHNHKRGDGCPLCRESKMEKDVRIFLDNHGILGVVTQKKLPPTNLKLDFFIEQTNLNGQQKRLGIECQGEQHYRPIEAFGGVRKYTLQHERDERKKQICNNNNIVLEYITYNENTVEKIQEIVTKYSLCSQSLPKEDLSQ